MDQSMWLCVIGVVTLIVAGLVNKWMDYKKAENDTAKRKLKKGITILCVLFAVLVAYVLLMIRSRGYALSYYIGLNFVLYIRNDITLALYAAMVLFLLLAWIIMYFAEKNPEKKQNKRKLLIRRGIFSLVLLAVVTGLSFWAEGIVQALVIVIDAVMLCACIWLISRLWQRHKTKKSFGKFTFGILAAVLAVVTIVIVIWNTFLFSPNLLWIIKGF